MRFNRKRIIAILVFLLLSFFMITFGNPLENKAIVTRNVKFIDSYDDKTLAEKTVELGKAVTAPTVPKHKDLVFINWYIKGTDTVANLDKILTNSTFVTRYADDKNNNGIDDKIDRYYTVKFIDGLNSNVLKTQRVLVGLDASAPVIPTHEGYTFGSWDINFTNVNRNLTVTGTYNINSYNLTINYNYAKDDSKAADTYTNTYNYNANYSINSPVITGYTANKLIVNGVIPASDVTINVSYTANKDTAYKVEHYKEALDGTYKLAQTDNMAGTTDTLTNAIAEAYTGFTVKAFDQLNINGNGSTIVKIYYTRNIYTLSYKVDGVLYDSFNIKYEEVITPLVNPTKTGYTFNGWSTIPSKMPANDVEINGTYTVNKYWLKIFYINENWLPMLVSPYIEKIDYGKKYDVTSPNIPGYTVDEPIISGTMTEKGKTVFVMYRANHDTIYTVEYYKAGVLQESDTVTRKGTTDTIVWITNADKNKYPGYTFTLVGSKIADIIRGDNSTVLKVNYRINNYNLNYNSNKPIGIVSPSPTPIGRNYTVEDEFNITAIMSSTSHNFLGWYYNKAGTGDAVTKIEKGTTGDKTLYAKWEIKTNTVTFDKGAHGTLSNTSTLGVPYNSTFGSIDKPIVTPDAGYTFTGWGTGISDTTRITVPITVTAQYTANTNTAYKVEHYLQNINDNNYTLDATENKTGTTDTDTSAVAKTLEGFKAKAFDQVKIAGDGGTVIKIYYDRLSYTLSYKVDGVVVKSDDIKYGTTITPLTEPSKIGYTFSGWSEIPTTMPAENVVITGTYTINSHMLTINYQYSDGDEARTQYSHAYNYNAGYSITSPVIAGYTADKLEVNGTMPDNDVTVDVTYTANTNTAYKVEHYLQNINDNDYTLNATENLSGTTDTDTSAVARTLTGFTAKDFDQENIIGNGGTVVKIYYDRNIYKLTYKVDSVVVKSDDIKYGTTIAPLAEPSKTGYTFSGWSTIPVTMPEVNVEINGIFVINKYWLKIFYTNEYGTQMTLPYVAKINYDTNYSVTSPVIAGYTADTLVVSGTMSTSDKTIFVVYAANTNTAYKVEHYLQNINDNNYTLDATENKTGTTDTDTSAVAKTLEGFKAKAFDQVKIAGDGGTVIKIYYDRLAYNLTFNPDNGDEVTSSSVKYGKTISAPSVTKTGYTFNSWTPSVPATMPAADSTYKATWDINSHTLTINYKYSNGTVAKPQYSDTYNYNASYDVTTPVIAGYTADKLVVSGTMPDNNVTVDVKYTANTNTAYKVEHYLQNINDNNYTLDATENKTGTTDTDTSAVAKTLEGFKAKAFDQVKIAGNGSTVIKIYYDRLSYTLSYKVDGIVVKSDDIKYGTTITPLAEPSKTGYTFSGWSTIPTTMPAANVEINGTFTINSHTLTINYQYSDGDEARTQYSHSYNYNAGYNVTSPEIAGYTADKLEVNGTMPDNDVTVDVTYTANTNTVYKVRYYKGTVLQDTVERIGTTDEIASVTNADKAMYTGWTFDTANTNNVLSGTITGNGSLVLKVYYKINNYTVTYNYEDANVIGETNSNSLTVYNIETPEYTLADATSTSDNFLGWYTLSTGGTLVTKLAGGEIGNVVLYAHWAKKVNTVSFDSNGGTTVLPLTNVYYGDTITEPTDPTKNGFSFADWYKEDALVNKWDFATDTVIKDLTLYANWNPVVYNLNFDMNASGVVAPITPTNPTSYTISSNLTFNNASSTSHNFLGWFTTNDNTGVKVTSIAPGTTGDKTYYAHWEIKKSTLTVDANGGVWSGTTPQTLDYGASLTIDDPTRDGYTFNGWTKSSSDAVLSGKTFTMGSENTTLTANWTVRTDLTYTIYYRLDGTTTNIKSPSLITGKTFGETYTETAPLIAGYEKLDTTKNVTVTTGTNEIIFYYNAIAVINASMTSVASGGSSTVEYGNTITYTLTITNTGTGPGLITAKDLTLANDSDKELIDTGLTASEIADRNLLLSNTGLAKTINAGATYTLVFKVKVIGNAGSTINNQLTYIINSEPEVTGVEKVYNIEKTVSLVRITESGANIVLTLDTSGSMEGSRLTSMKTAAKNFIDLQDLTKTNICIIRFSTSAEELICSHELTGNINSKKNQLKNTINGLDANGWTSYSSGFTKSEQYINILKNNFSSNSNYLVFLSDGDPIIGSDWWGGYIYDTGYTEIANRIKNNGTTIYTIGFETTNSADTILDGLASSGKYYKAATSDLNTVFANISADIEINGSITTTSGYADINTLLSGMDVAKEVTIVVNGTSTEYANYAAAQTAGRITADNRLNIIAFNPSDIIKFKYYAN